MNRSGRLLLVALAAIWTVSACLGPGVCAAAEDHTEWQIAADKLTRFEDPKSIIAEGHVVLKREKAVTEVRQPVKASTWDELLGESDAAQAGEAAEETVVTRTVLTTIKADWMAYDVDLGTVKAKGHVDIRIGPDRLMADEGVVDLRNETGTFHNATILREKKQIHLQGKVVEKTGAVTYHIEDGWIITCRLEDGRTPPWSFAAKEADITDNGYAKLKHATFNVKGVPVAYTPYMILPAKRTRQTGFLFPGFSLSDRDGFGLELPFFIDLSPSMDVTLYPQYLSKRGAMLGAEFRYARSNEGKGQFMANFLRDDLSDPEAEPEYYQDGGYTHTNEHRYWLRGKVDDEFGDWVVRLDVDVVSDRDYLTEFNFGRTGFHASERSFQRLFGRGFEDKSIDQRTSTFKVLRSWQDSSLQVEFRGINDVREQKTSPTPLWKLPAVRYTGLLPVGDTEIDFSWDADYVNYWRKDGLGTHRFDLFPRLSLPLPMGDYLEATLDAGIRDTFYLIEEYGDADWNGDTSENRLLGELKAHIGTTLQRDFASRSGSIQSWSHSLRPYLEYHYVPDVDQDDLPNLDQVDRIDEANLITYGVDNFFHVFGRRNGSEFDREYAYFKISQGYDLRSSESDTPLTPVHVKLGFFPFERARIVYKTDIDVYGDGFVEHSLESSYTNSRNDYFALDYRFVDENDIDSIKFHTRINLWSHLTMSYYLERSLADSKTVEENMALVYSPSCWSVELASNYTPGDRKFMLIFRLANIGSPLGLKF